MFEDAMRDLSLLFLVSGWFVGAVAQEPQASVAEPPRQRELAEATDRVVAELKLDGAALSVLDGGKLVHRGVHGQMTSEFVLPIASASKWLAVATVLSLVDEGKLDLDLPVTRYLPEFDHGDLAVITLRQCLACTAGFAAERGMLLLPRIKTMTAMAAELAEQSLHARPGDAFRYSGLGFQVAACAAERVTGQTWHELFATRIAAPLGMTATKFGRLLPIAGDAGTTPVPWVAGGAESTLCDYERFVAMLLLGGELDGKRVLTAASVRAMLQVQSGDAEVQLPGVFEGNDIHYGLGTWITSEANGVQRCSDPGAFGFTPWLDLDLGIGGVFLVRDRVARVLPRVRPLQDLARKVARSEAVAGRVETIELSFGGRQRRYRLHVPAVPQDARGLPVVMLLHGGGGNGEQVAEATGMAQLAAREGFVLVCPDGTGALRNRLLTWNSGGIDVYAATRQVDDVGFLRAVVADVARRVAIDPVRIHAVGHSNGAMMCHRLAREAADVFASVACVAGAMNSTDVDPGSPIHVLIVHGTADEHVLYDGGRPKQAVGRAGNRVDASVAAAVQYYRARNGLAGEPKVQADGKVRIESWERAVPGTQEIVRLQVVTLQGGGHSWPGGTRRALADAPFPFAASRAIWEFCQQARRLPVPAAAPR
ncbi:MAG: alpha/beta fold hydrolase [Planctomycetes bacterium]|nr:alpha/beta fold hydrolase [Planctomycetota bacterium]